jgi:hypothetical protein
MSHMPPGLVFTTDGRVSVTIRVQNFGRTPATVTDVNVTPFALRTNLPLPLTPTYRGTHVFPSTRAFLVADDHIFTTQSFPLPEFQQVMVGQLRLYLFGYVDYVDAFGQRHRGGYGRMFVADQHENNLVFVPNTSFNFDTIRQPGEGNDWNESF